MKMTAQLIDRLKPSASLEASARARELKAQGVDVISLSAGEPDFPTPEHVVEAAIRAMRDGDTRYTASGGTPQLVAAITAKFARDNALDYDRREVMAGAGLKNVIYLALQASLNPGDEVIVPAPYWVSYTDMTLLAGGVPRTVATSAADRFLLTPDALEAAITPRSRWLILNTPGNPTGAVYDRASLEALAGVLRRHPHVMVMTDEVYEHIVFDNRRFESLAQVAPDLKSRVLTLNGVSKAYAMTGWRIGYAGGPAELIAAMRKVQSQSTGSICSISQAAAVAALEGPQDLLAERCGRFEARRDRVVARLNGIDRLRCDPPEGAFYVYLDVSGLIGCTAPSGEVIETDADVARLFLDEGRVMTVLGKAYGLSPYVRLSTATSMDVLDTAVDRIAEVVANVR